MPFMACLTRSHGSKAIRPPKAPEPKSGGTAGGASSAGAVPGMKPREEKLAGYLMARAAMHRKIEGPVLQNLRAGHESVQQVRDLLPLGRANVSQDIEKAKDRFSDLHLRFRATTEYRYALARWQRLSPEASAPSQEFTRRIQAASSQHVETGVCSSHATNTVPLHAAKLADMKDERSIVAQAHHRTIDHTWAEMMPKGKNKNGAPILHREDVIMDGWCKEDLAILREDGEFARLDKNGKASQLRHEDLLNHETGPRALKEVAKYKAKLESTPQLKENFDDYITRNSNSNHGNEGIWRVSSVLHGEFRGQATAALNKEAMKKPPGKHADIKKFDPVSKQAKHASMAEIQAIGVARSLGANIRGAQAEAPKILAAAKELFSAAPSRVSNNKSFLSRLMAHFRP